MTVAVTLDQILQLAPNARAEYRSAFQTCQSVLDGLEISVSALRVAHFLAQVFHESGGLTIQVENLNYSANRLPVVWPSRFKPKGPLNPADYAHNPSKLANEVYGGRMGNTGPNDGYTFRGHGLLQLTGRDAYAEATRLIRQTDPTAPDFTQNPDAVAGPDWSLKVAGCEWVSKGCNHLADKNDVRAVTRAINGGLLGLAERTEWLRRTQHVWR